MNSVVSEKASSTIKSVWREATSPPTSSWRINKLTAAAAHLKWLCGRQFVQLCNLTDYKIKLLSWSRKSMRTHAKPSSCIMTWKEAAKKRVSWAKYNHTGLGRIQKGIKKKRFESQTHQNLDPFLQHQAGVVGGLADPHHGGHAVLLQLLLRVTASCQTLAITANTHRCCAKEPHLNKLVQGGIGGIVGNEEPHVLVCDLHGGWSVHSSHGDDVEGGRKKIRKPATKSKKKKSSSGWRCKRWVELKKIKTKQKRPIIFEKKKKKILLSFFRGY